MALIGYARCSRISGETRLQRDALRRAGVSVIFEEHVSAVADRPALWRAMSALQPGDVLVVWKLDRLARSLRDLLELLESLDKMAVVSDRSQSPLIRRQRSASLWCRCWARLRSLSGD